MNALNQGRNPLPVAESSTRLPNFSIGGALKGGTTSLNF